MANNQNNTEEIEIDLLRIFYALWHRAVTIVLVTVVFGAAAFGVSKFIITPKYQASILMYVSNNSSSDTDSSITSSDLTASKSLVNTCDIIIKSRTTLTEIIEETGLSYTTAQLEGMISASAVNSTEILKVVVTSTSPSEAAKIANAIAVVAPDAIVNVLTGGSVSIVDYAMVPTSPSSPNVLKYTALGMIVGCFLACAMVVLLELLDNKIHDEDYLIQTYNRPMLTSVPDLISSKKYEKTLNNKKK